MESDECSGTPSMSRNQLMTDDVHYVVLDDWRIKIRELSIELGLSVGLIQSILTEDLGMKHTTHPALQSVCMSFSQEI